MATLVSFHAHPDDESIHVGGTLAKLSAQGHRTVLVFATKGEHGEVADGFLDRDNRHLPRRIVLVDRLLTTLMNVLFGARLTDMFTGEDLGTVDDLHTFSLSIEPYSGRSLLVTPE